MKRIFIPITIGILGACCAMFAAPIPAFYRPHLCYIRNEYHIKVIDGKIYIRDHTGWFTVKRIDQDMKGAYYVNE